MRELTKSFLNLSWAMSLFGARNLGNLLSGGEAGKKAVEDFEAVTDTVVKRLGESFRQAFNTGEKLQDEIVDTAFRFCLLEDKEKVADKARSPGTAKLSSTPAIFGASSGANEEVVVVFTRGQGTFSADKRFIALDHVLFDIEGREVGFHQGVWEALFHDPRELLVRPAPPAGPMNQPVGPVPPAPVAANTKAIWAFNEGHSIESVGPAASHLIPLSDGSFLFLVSTGQIITGGTGRWEGAYGLTQSLGATHVPAGVDLFSDEITTFPATTFDTFKIKVVEGSGGAKRSSVSVSAPSSPPPATSSSSSAKPIVPPPSTPAMAGAHSAADEEVVVVYTRGYGTFSPDKRFIALNHDLFDVHGRKVGKHEGVWEALFSDPRELLSQPAPPTGPMNQPVGPVPPSPVAANTKAIWAFDDGSSIESVGPAASHLVPLADGSFLFLVSTGQVITGGTGRWEGAYGLTQSLGATHVPAGVDLFSGDVTTFPATTFDTFKIKIAKGGGGKGRSSVSVSTPQPIVPPASTPAMSAAHSAANEEVVVVYTRGQGTFSPDKRFIALNHDLFDAHGRKVGKHEGVWEALFKDPRELLSRPDPPTGPMNRPVGPVPAAPVAANTKAIWAFDDGSSIESVGPAASHLVPLSDGSFLFLVSTGQVITGGTGRWEGAYGLTQSLGATHVPAGVDLFSGDVTTFPATTFDTFKIKIAKGGPGGASGPDKRLDPASCVAGIESHFAEVKGSKMHYLDIGEGHPVIFLHGNPTWSYLWRNILPTVAENARCLAPDLIGMGLSDKPDIKYGFADQVEYLSAWIDKLELDDFSLVLHDWGCIIGFYYAMKNEEKIRKLAFMEAMYKPYAKWADFPEPLTKTFKMFRTPDIGFESIVVDNIFIEQLLPGSMLRKLSPTEMDCYRAPFADPASRKVIWRFAQDLPIGGRPKEVAKATSEYAKWLTQTELPKLLLYAEPGAINTQADVEWMESNLKNLETVSLGKGIHFHQEDQPEAIAQALARWL